MQKRIVKLLKNDFFQGGVIFTGTNFIIGFLNYFFNSLTAKVLGPAGYSEIIALFAYTTILSVPLAVLNTDLVRRLGSEKHNKLLKLKSWEVWLKSKLSKYRYFLAPYILLGLFIPRLTNLSIISSYGLLFIFAFSFPAFFYMSAFQGLHWFKQLSLILLLTAILKLAGPIMALLHFGGLFTIVLFLIISGFIPIFLSRFYIKRAFAFEVEKKGIKQIQRSIFNIILDRNFIVVILSLLAINLINNLDVIYVKKFFPAHEAGIYGAWNLFAKIIFFIFGSVTTLSLIFFSSDKHEKYHQIVLLVIMVTLSAGAVIGYYFFSIFGNFIISIIFSSQYNEIVKYLPQAALFGFFYSMIFILNNFFLAKRSLLSLIILFGSLIYSILLITFGGSLSVIFNINVYTSAVLAAIYILAIFYYNMQQWKPKNQPTS